MRCYRTTAMEPVDKLRRICMALPEATERLSHAETTWFVRGKRVFATMSDHHHDDRVGFWAPASPGDQKALVSAAPDRFFVPKYVGGKGWIGVYLDVPNVDWDEIAEIVEDAYRMIAPKKLIAELDA